MNVSGLLTVEQGQKAVLEHTVIRAGEPVHLLSGSKVALAPLHRSIAISTAIQGRAVHRRLPRPAWSDLGAAAGAATIAAPLRNLAAGRQAGDVCALIGAGMFGVWHYAQRL